MTSSGSGGAGLGVHRVEQVAAAGGVAVEVEQAVADGGVEQGADRAAGVEAGAAAPQGEEGVLDRVLGFVGVRQRAPVAYQARVERPEQGLQRRAVAGADAPGEVGEVGVSGHRRRGYPRALRVPPSRAGRNWRDGPAPPGGQAGPTASPSASGHTTVSTRRVCEGSSTVRARWCASVPRTPGLQHATEQANHSESVLSEGTLRRRGRRGERGGRPRRSRRRVRARAAARRPGRRPASGRRRTPGR